MTVAQLSRVREYLGNGSTKSFAVPFQFIEKTAIEVVLRDVDGLELPLVLDADFSVTGGEGGSGTVTLAVAPALGLTVVVRGRSRIDQKTTYTDGDTFPAESHERALDRAAMIDQEQQDQIRDTQARAFMLPAGQAAEPLPRAVDAANRFVAFSASGRGLTAVNLNPGLAGANPIVVASRAIMANLADVVEAQPVRLTEAVVEGDFTARAAASLDPAQVAADSVAGLYVPSVTDPTLVFVRTIKAKVDTGWFGASTDAADNRVTLQAALDVAKSVEFADQNGRYAVTSPIYARSGTVISGNACALENVAASPSFIDGTCIEFGQAHPYYYQQLTYYPVSSAAGRTLATTGAANFAKGDVIVLRSDERIIDATVNHNRINFHQWNAIVTAADAATVTLDEPIPGDWYDYTGIEIANCDEGMAGDGGRNFYIGFDQRLTDVTLTAGVAPAVFGRGGFFRAMITGVRQSSFNAGSFNNISDTVIENWHGIGYNKLMEVANNCRRLTVRDSSFKYYRVGDDPAPGLNLGQIHEGSEHVVFENCIFDAGEYAGVANIIKFGLGAHDGIRGSTILAPHATGNIIGIQTENGAAYGDFDPATTVTYCDQHFLEDTLVMGGASNRYAIFTQTAPAILRGFKLRNCVFVGAVALNGFFLAGSDHVIEGNRLEDGDCAFSATAARCVVRNNYFPKGLTFAGISQSTAFALNVIEGNESAASRRLVAASLVSTVQVNVTATTPNTQINGAPVAFAAGDLGSGDEIEFDLSANAGVSNGGAARTLRLGVDVDGVNTDIAVASTTVTTSAGLRIRGTIKVIANSQYVVRAQVFDGTTYTDVEKVFSGSDLNADGLTLRPEAWVGAAGPSIQVYAQRIVAKKPGMRSL